MQDSICPLCNNSQETIRHLLCECVVAKDFWHNVRVPPDLVNSFANPDLFGWLKVNCQSKVSHSSSIPWAYVFTFSIWNLWKQRNGMVFSNKILNENLHSVSKNQALEYFYCVGKLGSLKNKVVCNISWIKPPTDWCKLNTDGASLGNPGKAGGGGVIRDCEGRWMRGFARSIGVTTSIMAEFWALRDDLLLAGQIGVQNLVIELDAKVVVELVQSMSSSNAFYSSLLADCKSLLGRFQHYKVQHAFREVNWVADALAKLGCVMQEQFVILNSPPSDTISCYVQSDVNGESVCRLSAPNLAILA